MAPRWMTQNKFLKHDGNICPACESSNIEAEEFNPETMSRRVSCNECGAYWHENFKMVGYSKEG